MSQPDSEELIQSLSRGDMLSCCFTEALRLELTSCDLHFSSLPQNTRFNDLVSKGCSLRCKANKSYQGQVIFLLISDENKAKETMLVANDL